MSYQNLQFNILPFDWPKENITLYFHREEQPKAHRLHRSLFPDELETIFPGIENSEQDFVATSFDQPMEGFVPLVIDPRTDNPVLVKRYFNRKIYTYFKHQRQMIVRTGFINENQVWVPAGKLNTADCYVYECFSLHVQLQTVSD